MSGNLREYQVNTTPYIKSTDSSVKLESCTLSLFPYSIKSHTRLCLHIHLLVSTWNLVRH